ncbi:MAG: formylglycine-generating enzyme family protein [Ginsengibacter sp.]
MKTIFVILFLIASFTCDSQSKKSVANDKRMVKIGGGNYKTFYVSKTDKPIVVNPFLMDECAVTNEEFLEFVKANPEWSRSGVKRIFADSNYLRHWDGEFDIGTANKNIYKSPVVNVSWFAARAYCNWTNKRLPTVAEWEIAGSAPPKNIKYTSVTNYIMQWYEKQSVAVLPNVKTTYCNTYGLYDMHGLVWEWTFDFNSFISTGDSRNTANDDTNLFCAGASINVTNREDYAAFLRFGFRGSLRGNYCISSLGFRCAKTLPLSQKL